jgi:RNA polymerase sigma-70 factor (sigma-E family)
LDDAEEALFRDYATGRLVQLRRLGFLICGDWHTAEDAVSNVLCKLYVSWHKIRHTDNIDAYVRRMLVRAIIDERRRPWRRESPARYPLSGSVDAAPDAVHDRMVLREALSLMPPGRRAVLVLRYFEQLSVEETAAAIGCSTGTVKSQTARGLAMLRELLPADYLMQERGTS